MLEQRSARFGGTNKEVRQHHTTPRTGDGDYGRQHHLEPCVGQFNVNQGDGPNHQKRDDKTSGALCQGGDNLFLWSVFTVHIECPSPSKKERENR